MLGRILSLTVYRLVLVSLVLLYQLLAFFADFPIMPFRSIWMMVVGVSILTVCYLGHLHFFAENKIDLSSFVFTQFIFDILFVSILVILTGGAESNLRFAYLMIIVLSAVFLEKITIYVIMVLTLAFFFLALSSAPFLLTFDPRVGLFSDFGITNHAVLVGQTLLCLVTALLSGFMQSVYLSSRRALYREEQRVRSLEEIRIKIVESLPSGLITCDKTGSIHFVNRMGLKILQRSMSQLVGVNVWELFNLDPHTTGPIKDGERLSRVERRIMIGDANKILGLSYRPMEMEPGARGFMINFQDLTKIKLLEAHELLEDKMAAIGKVAAGVAHEIRNPLASISGSIQVLKEVLSEGPTAVELADIVARETTRLNEIISQFLAYARPGSPPSFQAVDILECLRQFVQITKNDAQMKDLSVTTVFPEGPCNILGDQPKLIQVFWNLLRNSYHACRTNPRIELSCFREEKTVILKIQDNGIGMTEEQLKDLFTPFQSFNKTGSGLGMSIVYDIIKMHHGTIDVRSKVGEGTAIIMRFPKYEE